MRIQPSMFAANVFPPSLCFISAERAQSTINSEIVAALLCLLLYLVVAAIPSRAQTNQEKGAQANALAQESFQLFQQGNTKALTDAIPKLSSAQKLFHEIGDKYLEASCFLGLGNINDSLGEKQKALENYAQSLLIYQSIDDKRSQAIALNKLGLVYSSLGVNQKALEYYAQALTIFGIAHDVFQEAATLHNTGRIYSDLGEKQKAFEYFAQSLLRSRAIGDRGGQGLALNSIGSVYSDLGEKQKALEYYMQALPLFRAVGDGKGEAVTLSNIGQVHGDLGEKQKALEFFGQALSLRRAVNDKDGEGNTLNSIAAIYSALGEKQKALESYAQALSLTRVVGDKRGEGITLGNIGNVYADLGEKEKALDYFAQALLLNRAVGDKKGEAIALHSLFYRLKSDSPRFAVFYGKLSVESFQMLRSYVQRLGENLPQIYLKSIEPTYRLLAAALIEQGRYAEAQQVLNSFKDQQYFDFGSNKQTAPPALTPRETALSADFDKKIEVVAGAIRVVDDFKRGVGDRQMTDAEAGELKRLENNLQAANDDYRAFLERAEKEFSAPPDEKDKVGAVSDLTEMQNALREISQSSGQKAVAVYQLVGAENFKALLITPDNIESVSSPIKADALNEKAKQLWALLQTPEYDPTKISKEIYDIVFKPLEAKLPVDAKTILWSLDGNLRYVPMAALYDGKHYLVERFNHVNFTRADKERMTRAVDSHWTATGFGSSLPHAVDLAGERVSFNALPGVGEELNLLFKGKAGEKNKAAGVFDGEIFEDARFTRANFLAALSRKRPVVHIASHFSFRAGDEARSFLLLGDGTPFTLNEMKEQKEMFAGVELLTLSACNTAAQHDDANGREVDAFFELAQRLGANSVIATLWSVADDSTPALMRDFYKLKIGAGNTKAEALRLAQIALLKGTSKAKPAAVRADSSPVKVVVGEAPEADRQQTGSARSDIVYIGGQDAPAWDKSKHAPFAHPFYWSPFVLFGNWR